MRSVKQMLWVGLPIACLSIGLLLAQLTTDAANPYVVEGTVKHFKPNDDIYYTETFVRAVRADGSQALRTTRAASIGDRLLSVDKREILDVVNARASSVDDTTKSVSTVPLAQEEIARLIARHSGPCAISSDSVAVESAPQLLGRDAVKVTTKLTTQEKKAILAVVWLAPSLDCSRLREEISEELPGGRHLIKVMQATSVVQTTPDASLFELPKGYTERPPGAVSKALSSALGLDCPACLSLGHQRADNSYSKKRSAAGWN